MKARSIVTGVPHFTTFTAVQSAMFTGEVKRVDENASMPKQFQVGDTGWFEAEMAAAGITITKMQNSK